MSRPFRKPRPVLAFGAFLQSNLQLCNKIGPSVDVSRFLSCGADRRRTDEDEKGEKSNGKSFHGASEII